MRKHNEEKPFDYSVWRKKDGYIKAHTDKNSYQCSVCDKLFDDNSHMKRHIKSKCSKIKPVSITLKKLFIRLMNPQEDNSVISEISTYDRVDDIPEVVEGHNGNISEISVDLKDHMRIHYGAKPVEFSLCRKENLYENTKVHTDIKSYQCSICDKLFDKNDHMKRHMKVKCGKIKPVCVNLKKLYIRSMNPEGVNSVISEINAYDRVDDIPKGVEGPNGNISEISVNSCENIDDTEATHKNLAEDINESKDDNETLVKSNDIEFECSVCDKSFSSSWNLNRHLRTHYGVKPFSCFACSKSFSRSEHLQRHKITHTKDKSFSCSLCEKAFTRLEHLQRHKKIHTDAKLYSCSICEKAFKQNEYLKIHLRTHTRYSATLEINTDDIVDNITGKIEVDTTNIPKINVDSHENTDFVKANHENCVDMNSVLVKSEVIMDPIDSEVDKENDNKLFKSEMNLNPIHEEVKTEDFVNDFVVVKTEIEDFDEEDIIDIVEHRID